MNSFISNKYYYILQHYHPKLKIWLDLTDEFSGLSQEELLDIMKKKENPYWPKYRVIKRIEEIIEVKEYEQYGFK